eukprot:Gregarina_sp_Poly_1__179@NODE_1040_length_5272_cov_13_452065_g720_i0_p1_GENE_NODE_1040_length_5272_cov_13_452065_g720_i0NODE_1040_length_5272_cov_13_452065_g720_i0_p1_ORF_typecomplete_len152_score13_29MAP70/PF07058_11/0_11_NODE_1040_length_5272_cov_13_452065_g720_i032783733
MDHNRKDRELFYQLASIRLLYMSLQAAEKLLKEWNSNTRKVVCENHRDEADIQIIKGIRNKIMKLLRKAFAAQSARSSSWLQDSSFTLSIEKLCIAAINSLNFKGCGSCDLDHLTKCLADAPSELELGLKTDDDMEITLPGLESNTNTQVL